MLHGLPGHVASVWGLLKVTQLKAFPEHCGKLVYYQQFISKLYKRPIWPPIVAYDISFYSTFTQVLR